VAVIWKPVQRFYDHPVLGPFRLGRRRPVRVILSRGASVALAFASVLGILAMFGRWSSVLDLLNGVAPIAWLASLFLVFLAVRHARRSHRWRASRALIMVGLVCLFGQTVRIASPFIRTAAPPGSGSGAIAAKLITLNAEQIRVPADVAANQIEAENADVIMLQEVSGASLALSRRLGRSYPYRADCFKDNPWCRLVILSRKPILTSGFHQAGWRARDDMLSFLWADVATTGGSIRLVELHLVSPGPNGRQAAQVAGLRSLLDRLKTSRTIVAGDFNMTQWSAALERTDAVLAMNRATGAVATWPDTLFGRFKAPMPFLAPDQIYTGPGLTVRSLERGPSVGAHNYPVVFAVADVPSSQRPNIASAKGNGCVAPVVRGIKCMLQWNFLMFTNARDLMVVLFFILAAVAGLLFLHPYLFYPLSLRFFKPRPVVNDPEAAAVSATLVFCAYNEERSLPDKIANLKAIRAAYPDIRFACYVDQSTDRTLELLQAEGDLIRVAAATERTGKALGMRRLAEEAQTDVMIFTDANVSLDPNCIPSLLGYFSDPTVGGVCGTLHYTNEDESPTARTSGAYWRLEESIKKLESRAGSTMGADGSIFATRRAIYPVVPSHLLDDFIVSMSVIFSGYRLVSASDVNAYERSASVSADEFRRKRRIATRAYGSHLYLWPRIKDQGAMVVYQYVSHRLLRWWGGPVLIAGLVSAILFLVMVGAWPLAALVVIVIAAMAVFGARARDRLVGPLYEIHMALAATMLGVFDALRGRRYQTWSPAQSR
jgi:endonuclease/exonuclease/phosphatase (EEP) superfamily protein YafD/cellulose synthase/poly-beta-1,6-N-acetylglucosamine synthase-like glycosyltransferase